MNISFTFKLFLATTLSLVACIFPQPINAGPGAVLDADLQLLYAKYVFANKRIREFTLNVVDYEALVQESQNKDSLYNKVLKGFAGTDPESIENREDRIAFWINAYNIGAIKMIVDHYPVDSIRSRKINFFKLPWGKKILEVGGKVYSLGEIEHDILIGTYREPMAHFAIVCASLSCPEINTEVYRGPTLRTQLAVQAEKFLHDPLKGLDIETKHGVVHFSQIFKFDDVSFTNGARDAIGLILPHVNREDGEYLSSGAFAIKYLDYDWSLNDSARAGQ